MHMCVCVYVHQVAAYGGGEEGEATVSVTDEVDEWKEGNIGSCYTSLGGWDQREHVGGGDR